MNKTINGILVRSGIGRIRPNAEINNVTVLGEQWRECKTWRVVVQCACGEVYAVMVSNLQGKTKSSCGCWKSEATKRRNFKHGDAKKGRVSKLWRVWQGMRKRCSDVGYIKPTIRARYYDKGIRVCEAWNSSFDVFREWSETNGYREGLTLDRINSNKHYCPENCEWVPFSVNARRARLYYKTLEHHLRQMVAAAEASTIQSTDLQIATEGAKSCLGLS